MSENPYRSPTPNTDDKPTASKSPTLEPGWRLLVLVFAVLGYFVGYFIRRSLGLSGVIPGAIFGGLGTGAGYLIAAGIIAAIRRGHARS